MTDSSRLDAIAVIGIGCRFPGDADSPDAFWQLLRDGVDAITPTPANRWNADEFFQPVRPGDGPTPGKSQSRWGGYLSDLDQFDPSLFGISPREAATMDPQHRLLLEVAYRALEDSGTPLGRIAGTSVAVFTGISSIDYAVAGLNPSSHAEIGPYNNTGASTSIAANRISYCFDLRGPSVAVDTACSSSLVALHLACETLRRGEATMALAGGVNALLLPDFFIAFSQLGVLSPDGRCKTFDARANGYARSEGAGMVLLKPLGDAIRDGDRIDCVINATAVNQDGRTPGLTVPSGEQQRRLVARACDLAGISPHQISYVEAHGTGTAVGDPIEARALGQSLSLNRPTDATRSRRDQPCWIGSVKTNIGHLEAGAGIASLIKVALAMRHETIPPHLHFRQPHPDIDLDRWQLRIPTSAMPWVTDDGQRYAGINGFGYGGTNAHVIVSQPPQPSIRRSAKQTDDPRARLLPISATDAATLPTVAGAWADWLETSTESRSAIAATATRHRTHHAARGYVVGRSRRDWIERLRQLEQADAPETPSGLLGDAERQAGLAFLCCGQGPQWWGMGRGLFRDCPPFRETIERIDAEFAQSAPSWSLIEELQRDADQSRMASTAIAQPALFAIQVAQAAAWAAIGIVPAVVIGHSVGEIAAAYLAGGLDFTDACRVAIHRGRTMDLASSRGGMVALGMSAGEARSRLKRWQREHPEIASGLSIAAINGPQSITLSGDRRWTAFVAGEVARDGVFCRELAVEYAFHSPQMDPVESELRTSLDGVVTRPTHTPMISTVTGRYVDETMSLGGDYWWDNVRQSVRFADAMILAAREGFRVAVELGPHPVLTFAATECYGHVGERLRSVATARRPQTTGEDEPLNLDRDHETLLTGMGQLFQWGIDPEWSALTDGDHPRVDVPTYPMQKRSYWFETEPSRRDRLAIDSHPLLGLPADGSTPRFTRRLETKTHRYLLDHRVRETVLFPAAAAIEMTLAAALRIEATRARLTGNEPSTTVRLERFQLLNPLVLDDDAAFRLETTHRADRHKIEITFRPDADLSTTLLAKCELRTAIALPSIDTTSLDAARDRCEEAFDSVACYDYCETIGLIYGETFRGIRDGVRRIGESVCRIELSAAARDGALEHAAHRYHLHPAVLDSCFHAMVVCDPDFRVRPGGLYLPHEIESIDVDATQLCGAGLDRPLTAHAMIRFKDDHRLVADIDLWDDDDTLVGRITGFESRRVGLATRSRASGLLYRYRWQSDPDPAPEEANPDVAPEPTGSVIVLAPDSWDDESIRRELGDDRVCHIVRPSENATTTLDSQCSLVDPESVASFSEFLERWIAPEHSSPHHVTIVYGWGLNAIDTDSLEAAEPSDSAEQLRHSALWTTRAPLHLVQSLEAIGGAAVRLLLVTEGAQSSDEEFAPVNVAQSPLIGLGRVIISESSVCETRLVDLPVIGSKSTTTPARRDHRGLEALRNELVRHDAEDEVRWRDGQRWVHRFGPDDDRWWATSGEVNQSLRFELAKTAASGIDDLHHRTRAAVELSASEIEIEVAGAGLNFSDVMKVLDLYPGLPPGPVKLGAEVSGIVTRVGRDVAEIQVGDAVIAVAPGGFASHVVVDQALVAPAPRGIDLVDAAAIPIAWLTADHALVTCARMRAGESVLVHAASGGVGLAAIDIARDLGVEVFGSAGSDVKRDYLKSRGVAMQFDSRSLSFASELLDATSDRHPPGVDAVLNSLPGEAILAGMSVLKPGGRFLEIGKRDIYSDGSLGLYPFRNNLAFFAIDLDLLFQQQPRAMGERLRAIVSAINAGRFSPVPPRRFESDDVASAFRFMQTAQHVGKVVVDYRQPPARVRSPDRDDVQFDSGATAWLAGGLGGFGLRIARWMVEHGARTLVLSGRNAQPSPSAAKAIEELESLGATVVVLPCDIVDPEQVTATLSMIDRSLPPLRTVIHTAMVLEDRLLVDLDRETLDRVLWPKVLGGWNLHRATEDRALDHFILFSSLSSQFGHAGQANYSAANALLDALAHHRRQSGQVALVINWGHVGEVGYLARREELSERLRRQGVLDFSADEATACLGLAINRRATQCSVLRIDWSRWRGLGLTKNVSPRFAHLIRGGGGDSLNLTTIGQASPVQRRELLHVAVAGKLGSLLGREPAELPPERPMLELGLDSLMAVELRNWIEGQLQLKLQIGALMRGSSLRSLVETLAATIDEDTKSSDSVDLRSVAAHSTTITHLDTTEPTDPAMSDPARFPMSDQQTGLWYAFRRDPNSTAFNVFLPTRLRSRIDVNALTEALQLIARRHASLRTTFSDADGQLLQIVHDELPVDVEVIDRTRAELSDARESDLKEVVIEETQRPFDLQRGPLLRLQLFKLADDDWVTVATAHHIVTDFWSLILILGEVRKLYPLLAAGESLNPATLAPPPRDYFDLVATQRRLLASSEGERLREYWLETLRDVPTVLEVPTDRIRPATFTRAARVAAIRCPMHVGRAVNELATQTQTTSSAVVLAALQVLLSRLTGQNRFIIGSPFAGRTDAELEDTVGFFVNMLPLVADLNGRPSFTQLVRRAGDRLIDSMQHESYPFAQIVRDVDPPRDTSRSPLIQVSCTFEKAHVREEQGRAGYLFPAARESRVTAGLREESFYIPHQTCHYDIEFIFEQSGDDLRGMIVYCRDLYDADTMMHLSDLLVGLLSELLARPQLHVHEIAWPATSLDTSATSVSISTVPTVVEMIEQACRQRPRVPMTLHRDDDRWPRIAEISDRRKQESTLGTSRLRKAFWGGGLNKPASPTLRRDNSDVATNGHGHSNGNGHANGHHTKNGNGQSDPRARETNHADLELSYQSWQRSLGRITQILDSHGLTRQSFVPVVGEPGPETMTMIVAVMMAGGVPVPIDRDKPALDCDELLRQTGATLILVDEPSAWHRAADVEVLTWSSLISPNSLCDPAPATPDWAVNPDELAYVIFTSGTTGTPKGVMVPHSAIANTLAWRKRITPIGPHDRVFMPLSHQFDAGLGMSLLALASGATLVWPTSRNLADLDAVVAQLRRDGITILPGVPSWIDLVASHPSFGSCDRLRQCWVGGEPMPETLPRLIRRSSDAAIWNCYGPTEAAVEATAFRIQDIHDPRPIPVGHPADHTDVVILDQRNRPVPATFVGQIALVGAGLARGYLNRDDLTAASFIMIDDGRRAYLTGDRGRRRVDGLVEVLGREDRQVKIGGYRIEPVEIETVLRDHPAVAKAAVVMRSLPSHRGSALVAYVELDWSASEPTSAPELANRHTVVTALRHHLAEHLPPYKRPRLIEIIDQLPIGASGKVELSGLPIVVGAEMPTEQLVPPSTPLEQRLAAIWAETLDRNEVSVCQNFFELGGSSLEAAMLTNRLSDELGVHVPSSLLFDLADISSMAQRLVQLHPAAMRERFGDGSVRFYDGQIFASSRVSGVESLIAPLKTSGELTPLFLIHPPGGIVVCYRELAAAMPDSQPLYAVRSRGLHGNEPLPESLPAMAAEYVQAIRLIQPTGPYFIGGWSIGGIIAAEVAQQLIADAESILQLVLLDTSIPTGSTSLVPAAEQTNVGLEYGIDMTLEDLIELKPEQQLPFLWQHAERMGLLDDATPPEVAARAIEDLKGLFHHHIACTQRYRLEPIDADVLLIRPADVPNEMGGRPDRGWGYLARNVRVQTIPGHHHSMIQPPQVQHLAETIVTLNASLMQRG